jgi:hypothetical protein
VDKSEQALYGTSKCLIYKDFVQVAQFLSTEHTTESGLSQAALDNGVDKFAQALYGTSKCLICNDFVPCNRTTPVF